MWRFIFFDRAAISIFDRCDISNLFMTRVPFHLFSTGVAFQILFDRVFSLLPASFFIARSIVDYVGTIVVYVGTIVFHCRPPCVSLLVA